MALTVSHTENQMQRKQAATKRKNEQKPDNLEFLGRLCSSALTIRTVLKHSYPTILNHKTKFIIPRCSFILWIYVALLVNLSHLMIKKKL